MTGWGTLGASRIDASILRRRAASGLLGVVLCIGGIAAQAAGLRDGLVLLADGDPFTVIRDYRVMAGTRGVTLSDGDFVETPANGLLIVTFPSGAVVAIGPSSSVYLLARSDVPTLVALRGWVKLDTLGQHKSALHRVLGTRLGAASSAGTLILHAGESEDQVFHESGAMTLLLMNAPSGTGTPRESKVNQFFVRQGQANVVTPRRPTEAFVDGMPRAFNDQLPTEMASRLRGKTPEFKVLREASYDDVSAWLSMPRDWRQGFIERFRPRLRDPAFFAALDRHINSHTEWAPILHPPPPPEEDRATNPAAGQTSLPRPH